MTPSISSSISLAVVAFLSTDVDNMIILTAFFADPSMRPRSVFIGQFLGMVVLVFLSAISGMLAWTITPGWIALMGFIPLTLGLFRLVALLRHRVDASANSEAPTAQEKRLQARTHSQAIAVALVTLAHGGDNLGVYIPMFAHAPSAMYWYVSVFLLMTILSSLASYHLVSNRYLRSGVQRVGRVVMPFVLMGLGVNILWGARQLF